MAFLKKDTSLPLISYRARRAIAPYMYLAPTMMLLAMLMLLPMIIVVRYSLLDNVIMNKNPVFVGLQNYTSVLADETFRISVGNTLYFTIMSVIFHLLIGLSFALLLNSKLINGTARSILRVFYIMPWVFTATIIAIIWRLLLNPSGVINYILTTLNIAEQQYRVALIDENCASRGDVHQYLGGVSVLYGEPSRRSSGGPRRTV